MKKELIGTVAFLSDKDDFLYLYTENSDDGFYQRISKEEFLAPFPGR